MSTGQLPTADEEVASRAVNEFLRASYWAEFSQPLRQFLVSQLAEQAPLTKVSTDAATLKSAYSQIQPYLYSSICMTTASAFSQAQAQSLASGGTLTGAHICLSQAEMEDQPAALRNAVQKLTVGQTSAPIRTSYGYQVVKLESRSSPGFSVGVQRVLTVATASTVPPAVSALIDSAQVKVNPAYGTWAKGRITTPQLSSS